MGISAPAAVAEAYGATWDGSKDAPTKDDVYDKLEALGLFAASTTPVASQSGDRTASVAVSRHVRIGKLVIAYGTINVSNAGAAGNAIRVTVPVTAAAGAVGHVVGSGWILDSGTASYASVCRLFSTALIEFYTGANTSGNPVGVGPSFALASGDSIFWHIVYEAA